MKATDHSASYTPERVFPMEVLHQVLQWHHMVSSWYPPTTIPNLELNTL